MTGGSGSRQWRTATEAGRTADEYAVWLSQLLAMQGLKLTHLDGCIISSVVPQSLFNLRNLARRYLHVEPLVIGENAELGIPSHRQAVGGGRRPAGQHPGRLAGLRRAADHRGLGTATTFDVVAEDGGFEGGVIAPGVNLSMQALHDAAARLPRVAIRRPGKVVGTDTVGAMQSGVFWGYVALIDGLIARIKAEYGRPMTVVATGGVASLFEGATSAIDRFDPDLTLRGLLEIWRRNTPE
jgi:type III pantothenate kinase